MSIQNPVLKQFLNLCVTPERSDALSEVADFLSEIGDETHHFAIESILSRFDNEEPSQVVMDIQQCLMDIISDQLMIHGVLIGDYDLLELTAVLRCILQLPNYGDPQELLDVLDSADTPECALAELTERFSFYHWVDVVHVIAEVKYSLIESMREVLQKNVYLQISTNGSLPTTESINIEYALQERRNRLRVFVEDNANDYIVIAQVRSGMALNEPLSYYVEAAHAKLQALGPEDCTQQLIAMAYASNLPAEDIQDAVHEYLEEFMGNISQMTKANFALESALGY